MTKLQTHKHWLEPSNWLGKTALAAETQTKNIDALLAYSLQTNGITANVCVVTLIVPVLHGQTKEYATTGEPNLRAQVMDATR